MIKYNRITSLVWLVIFLLLTEVSCDDFGDPVPSGDPQTNVSNGIFIETNDGGATWNEPHTIGNLVQALCITLVATEENNILVAGTDKDQNASIHRIDDWEFNFSEVKEHNGITYFADFASGVFGDAIAVGEDGVIFGTEDGGSTWSQKHNSNSSDLNGVGISSYWFIQSVGIAVGNNGAIVKTIDGGDTWNDISLNKDVVLNDVFIMDGPLLDSLRIIVVGNNGLILSSTDSGLTWEENQLSGNKNLYAINIGTDANEDAYLLVVGHDGFVYKSTDMGFTWALKSSSIDEDPLFDVTASSAGECIAVGKHTIKRSVDYGETWQIVKEISSMYFYGVLMYDDSGTGFVVGKQY